MTYRSRTSVLLAGGAVALVALLAVVVGINANGSTTSAGAQDSAAANEDRGPFWFQPAVDEERSEARLDRDFHGLTLGPDVIEQDICKLLGHEDGALRSLSFDELSAQNASLALPPPYVPSGATLLDSPLSTAGACDDEAAFGALTYDVERGDSSAFGGSLFVYRAKRLDRYRLDVAEARTHETEVAGRPALVVAPISDDGFGDSFVIVRDGAGATLIQGDGLTESELLRVAHSMYEEAS